MFSGLVSERHWAFSLLGLQAWGRGRKRTIFSQVCSTSVEQSSPLLVRNFRLILNKYLDCQIIDNMILCSISTGSLSRPPLGA